MPRVTIDNRPVEVVPGSNLLAACRKLGLDVPALCYHPACPPLASCLACLVKVKDPDRIVPSCATLAEEGMVVESETDEIRALRRTALELLLSDHCGDCAWLANRADPPPSSEGRKGDEAPDALCAKEAVCRLRRYGQMYGANPVRFQGMQRAATRATAHPEVQHDPAKCILCGICVDLARQAGEPLGLAFVGRGFDVRVEAPLDAALVDALQTIARRVAGACPTGALTVRPQPKNQNPK